MTDQRTHNLPFADGLRKASQARLTKPTTSESKRMQSTSPARWLKRGAGFAALAFVLAACASDAELNTRADLAGPEAIQIENFTTWILIVTYVVFALVMLVSFEAWRRYRVKGDDYEDDVFPAQVDHNTTAEILFNGIPFAILVVVGFFTFLLHWELNGENDVNPITVDVAGQTIDWEPEIVVVGQQWWWEYQYHFGDVELTAQRVENLPVADITTATQMVIPVGQEIELEVTSRDVIHSHWIPALNGKRDAVPGRQSAPWKIQADEPGVFFGQCTEFCGLSHSRMRMQVIALEMPEFQAWVSAQMQGIALDAETQAYVDELVSGATPAPENSSERAVATFRGKCASCHLLEGVADDLWSAERVAEQLVSGAAPNLTHFASRTTFAGGIVNVYDPDTGEFNENDLRAWLRNPADVKANFTEPVSADDPRLRGMPNLNLTTEEVDDLVGLLQAAGERPSDFVIQETGVE